MNYVEFIAKNRIVNDDLLNKILNYNNIYDLDLLNKTSYPYDYKNIDEFIKTIDKMKKNNNMG